MFDQLFRFQAVITRHANAPRACDRERFLVRCRDEGYARPMLGLIAWQLLVIASTLDLDRGPVSVDEITRAAVRPARFGRRHDPAGESPLSTQKFFISVAKRWLAFLGRLAPKAVNESALTGFVDKFERYMREERGLSSVTITTRCERLNWFLASLPRQYATVDSIKIADVDRFLAAKGQAGWSRASVDVLAASLRSFFQYALGQRWCTVDIAASVRGPRLFAQERLPRGASWQDVQRLLDDSSGNGASDIRDHAILMLLALYGLRAGEVAALRLDDIDWDLDRLYVTRPKQRCAQEYPWLPSVGDAVLRYLREVRPRCAHRALFLTMKAPPRPLSSQSVCAVARAWLTSINVQTPSRGAHCLRHACAAQLLASGFSFKQIGDHLGHRSTNATFVYAKVDLVGLRQVAELDMGALL